MKKSVLAWLLALAMLVACLPGLADTSPAVSPKGVFPIVEEPIELRVWCNLPADASEGIETNEATAYLENLTNIHINWEKIGINEAAEKLRVMMAANTDLPDVIMTANVGSIMTPLQIYQYGMQGLLYPLNDLIDEYGDAWYDAMEIYPGARAQVTAPDGNIYGLGSVSNGAYHVSLWQKFYINQAWLDYLNLETPTTIDEFYDVLVAFRDGDPNQNGIADEVPLSGSVGTEYCRTTLDYFLMNAFQYSTSFENCWLYLEDENTVGCGAVTENWREGLRWLRKLYAENLMDKEIFINTKESLTMLSGAADGNKLGSFSAMFQIAGVSTDNPEFENYVALSPLEGPNGRCSADNPVGGASMNYLITHSCQNPEAAFRLGDYLMTIPTSDSANWATDSTNMIMRYGYENVGWRPAAEGELGLNGEQALFTMLPGKEMPDGSLSTVNCRWYEIGPCCRSAEERNSIATDPGVGYNIEQDLWDETHDYYEPFRVKRSIPSLVFTSEENEIMTDIIVNIQNYGNEMLAMFVTGEKDIENDWDEYVSTMNDFGLPTLVEIYQHTYEQYKANM